MGIGSFISSKLNQSAVYWGNPQDNGYGGFTYDDPVEIKCRWEDMHQVVTDTKGEEVISRAVVYVDIDLEENGVIYLGTMEDLIESSGESSGEIIPTNIEKGACIIRRWEKVPALNSSTEFIRTAYLTPYISWE